MTSSHLFCTHTGKRRSLCCALLCFLFLVSLAGCKPPIGGGAGTTPPPPAASPLAQAKNAFVHGEYAKAEAIAMRLGDDTALSTPDRMEANRVLTAAALKTGHPSVALTGLEQWRKASPGADGSVEWQDAWCKALRALSSHDARTRANDVYQDSSRSLQVRSMAGAALAVRQWQDGELGQTLAALENIYSSAESKTAKAALERRLALELHLASKEASRTAASAVTEDNMLSFPYNLILIDKLRRESSAPQTRDAAQSALQALASASGLADPALVRNPPKETPISIQGASAAAAPSGPVAGRPVVLTLPLSGQYAAIAGKIVAGAQAACDELNASGNPVSLIVIDTEQPDWTAKVDGLPANATVVGGPMRRADYTKAKSSGLTSRKALFAFLPGLEQGDEGRVAWRFFSSPQDQVDALLAFTSRLGINGYAAFYPEDNYGRRMAELFEQRARAAGAGNVFSQSYIPGDQNNWMASASTLLGNNKSGRAFRAIFLPDSWKNMDVIVPNFFYYNETRQVLLGTALWEQGLAAGGFVSMQYYNLAVFPGAWNGAQPTPSGQKLQSSLLAAGKDKADFWAGLGYDFARFAANLGVGEGFTPSAVNSALQASSINWSIAPIRWSGGMASQQMHLFVPAENGFVPLDEGAFRSAFEEAWR